MTSTRTWILQNSRRALLLTKKMILKTNWWRGCTRSTSCTLSKTSRPSSISCRWSRIPNQPFHKSTKSFWTSGKPNSNHSWARTHSNSKTRSVNWARDSKGWSKIARIHKPTSNRSKTSPWESSSTWMYMPIYTMLVPRLARSLEESLK